MCTSLCINSARKESILISWYYYESIGLLVILEGEKLVLDLWYTLELASDYECQSFC